AAASFGPEAAAGGVTLRADPGGPADLRVADADTLKHVLDNLVANALKFTLRGGTIDLQAEADGAGLRLVVADTGIGVPEAELGRLFERFFRASNSRGVGGSGLGLYIVRRLVERAGGQVSVASQLGEGTRFTVWLPGISDQ
ncbi:MAG: sensor histidine kinase, partial [Deferrisomatales bacterium]